MLKASCPSVASPTTVRSDSRSSRSRRLCRNNRWSSAITSLIVTLAVPPRAPAWAQVEPGRTAPRRLAGYPPRSALHGLPPPAGKNAGQGHVRYGDRRWFSCERIARKGGESHLGPRRVLHLPPGSTVLPIGWHGSSLPP